MFSIVLSYCNNISECVNLVCCLSFYSRLGMLAAMSLVHGGASFKLFSLSIYNFMCGWEASNLIVGIDEVPQCDIREILNKVITDGTLQNHEDINV